MFRKIEQIIVHYLLALINLLLFVKKILFIFLKPFQKTVYFLSKLFFYHIIVRIYKFYRFVLYKLGWSHFKSKKLTFIFTQKPLHVTVAILIVFFLFNNILERTRAAENDSLVKKEQTILDTLVSNEFSTQEENQLIEEFFDQEAYISKTQQSYLNNLGVVRPQLGLLDNNYFTSTSTSTLDSEDSFNNHDNENITKRNSTEIYTVQPGDTISTIARKFGITVSTILWENDLTAYSVLHPGDELTILPESGLSYVVKRGDNLNKIANNYNVELGDLIKANNLSDSGDISVNQKIFIPGAKKTAGIPTITKKRNDNNSYSGLDALIDIIKPSNAKPAPGNKMQWPTVGHVITQYYSSVHRGLDIANKIGTPLYAADSGVIEYAGWGTGYGNQVVVDHGGGKKTRYAHASKLYVKKGDYVDKGETIAAMGSTGWSTGPHIHFEVIINGVKYNPLNYIK